MTDWLGALIIVGALIGSPLYLWWLSGLGVHDKWMDGGPGT